jgi:hypothetical protein
MGNDAQAGRRCYPGIPGRGLFWLEISHAFTVRKCMGYDHATRKAI